MRYYFYSKSQKDLYEWSNFYFRLKKIEVQIKLYLYSIYVYNYISEILKNNTF
jgi:hypothetical protein